MIVFKKIKTLKKIFKIIKNRQTYFLDYFGLIKGQFVEYELKNGVRYKTRSKTFDRYIINEVWIHNLYTQEFGIREKDIVLDIGAHIGIFSIFASKIARKGKVYAFEPSPESFKLLKENISLNNLKNIIPVNKGFSSKKGGRKMYISNEDHREDSFYSRGKKEIEIKTISLNDFFKEYNIDKIDFLKMDCEGAEYEIFRNSSKKSLRKLKKIAMEYHNIGEKKNLNSLKAFFKKNGFVVKEGHKGENNGILYLINTNS